MGGTHDGQQDGVPDGPEVPGGPPVWQVPTGDHAVPPAEEEPGRDGVDAEDVVDVADGALDVADLATGSGGGGGRGGGRCDGITDRCDLPCDRCDTPCDRCDSPCDASCDFLVLLRLSALLPLAAAVLPDAAGRPVRALIRLYRRRLTRYTPRCPETPSCSAYALAAVETLGARRGLAAAARRLRSCGRPAGAAGTP